MYVTVVCGSVQGSENVANKRRGRAGTADASRAASSVGAGTSERAPSFDTDCDLLPTRTLLTYRVLHPLLSSEMHRSAMNGDVRDSVPIWRS